jgi:alpha-amylase
LQPEPPAQVPALGGRSEGTWYEIFTGSFCDSNGDGIGDLNGIAMKLDYLNDSNTDRHYENIAKYGECNDSLHVDGIWLTPIMPSPSYHKYDTMDYMAIDPQFGTIMDFQNLLEKCHEHNIKVIIDMVMNHSSDQHEWFKAARREIDEGKPGKYAAYYNFYYGKVPPMNETANWKWSETDHKWYIESRYYKFWGQAAPNAWWEGSFWTGMPDLNWDNQSLREEFEEVVKFWLRLGLDGFRLDATSWPYDFDTFGQMWRDWEGVDGTEKNIELWTWFNDLCHSVNNEVYLVGECWKDEDTIANYYRSGMNYFAFGFLGTVPWALDGHGKDWTNAVISWERRIKTRNPRAVSAVFLSNHDQGRSFYNYGGYDYNGDWRRKMAASLYLLSPGTPFIYYGEEIGLVNYTAHENSHEDSDQRGPMWWSNTNLYATPNPPEKRDWIDGEGYDHRPPPSRKGVEEQLRDEYSLLRHYIRISNIKRQYPWVSYAFKIEGLDAQDPRISAYRVYNPDVRDAEGKYLQSLVVAHNVVNEDVVFNWHDKRIIPDPQRITGLSARDFKWIVNKGTGGDDGKEISMPPYSSAIITEFEE